MNPYLEELLINSNCAPDVLPFFGNYKNTKIRNKEITESMGCYVAVRDFSGFNVKDPEVLCFVVGDGSYPRTASIIAHMTSFDVISIDPEMNIDWFLKHKQYKASLDRPVRRLEVFKAKIEDCKMAWDAKKFLLVLPHSHANLKTCLQVIDHPCTVVNLPCCVRFPNQLTYPKCAHKFGYINYEDPNIMSGKRKIHIWKNLTHTDV